MSKLAKPVILGAMSLTAITLGMQYLQHSRENQILVEGLQIEHSTEFEAPQSQRAPSTSSSTVALNTRLSKLERALNWLESQSPEAISEAVPSNQPLRNTATTTHKAHQKIDTHSSHKLTHRRHDEKDKKEAKKQHGANHGNSHGNVGDEPFLLERILKVVEKDDITNYPAWYFGAKGARGYFEDGPWAELADVNLSNENYCGKERGLEGPWRVLNGAAGVKPSRGRKAIVATVSRCAICDFLGTWDKYGLPEKGGVYEGGVVLIGGGNENWGMFSEHVENRSVAWGKFEGKLKSCGKTMKDFHRFMNDPRILLWVTNQHQAAGAVHPKVLSLPLGMKNKPDRIYNEGMVKYAATKKKKLLIINNSGWKHREGVNLLVGAKFDKYGVRGNQYSVEKGKKTQDYYEQIAEAKFVLCPSGMGYDTYRHWEVLLMGSIPVFESSPGFDRTFAKLPVVIVNSYDEVTPELLEAKYAEFAKNADELFDFTRLKKSYWMDMIFGVAARGTPAELVSNHPPDKSMFRRR